MNVDIPEIQSISGTIKYIVQSSSSPKPLHRVHIFLHSKLLWQQPFKIATPTPSTTSIVQLYNLER